ncbi:MAG TPA: phosphate acetyltransferase [Candidatus Avichristensenella intestinipullorum]|uniref:Phosphate acetyltransferase n=1 Tax=Candidatus Avichristensenella intestinipullorum TaxID=2840693 RepID=A0A9D0Z004_9FIRM|nr:phosphate acetyltransferase [Candidatus Avichristensenella intestinipullorum]
MSAMEQIRAKAKAANRHIVLAEGTEERTVQAAARIVERGIARVTLVGPAEEVRAKAAQFGVSLEGVAIVDPATDPRTEGYALALYELRKAKGMTPEEARKLVTENTLYFGTMMLKMGDADGMVAGAINSTGNVLRPALQIIKTAPGISVVSSCFIMESPRTEYGQDGLFIFGDCAVIPNPTADELAAIAVASAQTGKALLDMDPKVAMLSFSTKGSAKHDLVTKVQQATEKVRALAPELSVDGELQADAALVESVGRLKSPGSTVAGHANVLIFPDLQAGNIGYKLVQRLGGAMAIGPIIQGLAKPVNDLSRGCSIEDIVDVTAVTAARSI